MAPSGCWKDHLAVSTENGSIVWPLSADATAVRSQIGFDKGSPPIISVSNFGMSVRFDRNPIRRQRLVSSRRFLQVIDHDRFNRCSARLEFQAGPFDRSDQPFTECVVLARVAHMSRFFR